MTLAHAIAHAPDIARDLRRQASNARRDYIALRIEQARAVEIMADVCRTHLAPAPSGDIAEAMLNPCARTNAWLVRRLLKQTHGKNGVEALPVVPEEPKS
jgi:hypothetical protein